MTRNRSKQNDAEMRYACFGRTGLRVSRLCLGAGRLGGDDQDRFDRCVGLALDRGVNLIDTANIYQNGRNEEQLGRALRGLGRRDEVLVATKVEGPMGPGPLQKGISRRHIVQQCDESLRRLGTDWIDVYQLHCSHGSTVPIDEPLGAFDDLIRAGKARYCGTSHYAPWQLMESVAVSRSRGGPRFVSEQCSFHPLDRWAERELLPFAESYGLALLLWSPLAFGFLGGRYRRGDRLPKYVMFREMDRQPWRAEQAWAIVDELRRLAGEKGVSMAALTLAWTLSRGESFFPLIGGRNEAQIDDALTAVNVTIEPDEEARIDALIEAGQTALAFNGCGKEPPLNGDWGPHRFTI